MTDARPTLTEVTPVTAARAARAPRGRAVSLLALPVASLLVALDLI